MYCSAKIAKMEGTVFVLSARFCLRFLEVSHWQASHPAPDSRPELIDTYFLAHLVGHWNDYDDFLGGLKICWPTYGEWGSDGQWMIMMV